MKVIGALTLLSVGLISLSVRGQMQQSRVKKQNTPSEVIKQLLMATGKGDEKRMVRLMSKANVKDFDEYSSRLKKFGVTIRKNGGIRSITIIKEHIFSNSQRADPNGNKAIVVFTVKFHSGEEQSADWDLIKENGVWKFRSY